MWGVGDHAGEILESNVVTLMVNEKTKAAEIGCRGFQRFLMLIAWVCLNGVMGQRKTEREREGGLILEKSGK
ncbi:unnamed protein product [Onchocerca ochengi]|uniref:Uncharacterized protein n=1 Tax=Onchocerca ochengi TaxID=42157 RepID=A0A182EG64_ONCOC|nr:unnamed protein product [Onchocerca ochengi]